jgi:aminoglycoside/choline kinase family phosphotransferase
VDATDAVNENDAFGYLAAHLGARGIPVPAVLAYERSRGWLLVDDLGDRALYREVLQTQRAAASPFPADRERVTSLYREAIDVLVRLQVDGAEDFDPR